MRGFAHECDQCGLKHIGKVDATELPSGWFHVHQSVIVFGFDVGIRRDLCSTTCVGDFAASRDPHPRGEQPWNVVTLGDGRSAWLKPAGYLNRNVNLDGSLACNHPDATPCDRTVHTTISLYEVEITGAQGARADQDV